MIIPLSPVLAATLSKEFAGGEVKKEYIARCRGEFPEGDVVCDQPLLTVDRQMGLNIVHPEGKVKLQSHELITLTLMPFDLRISLLRRYSRGYITTPTPIPVFCIVSTRSLRFLDTDRAVLVGRPLTGRCTYITYRSRLLR